MRLTRAQTHYSSFFPYLNKLYEYEIVKNISIFKIISCIPKIRIEPLARSLTCMKMVNMITAIEAVTNRFFLLMVSGRVNTKAKQIAPRRPP